MKKAVVTFPAGMTVNPSAAQGLGSCSPDQIGLGTDAPVTCPDDSQFGTLTVHTPILPIDAQPEGFIYVAKPFDNPFHNFLSLYLVIQEPERGILVKVAGQRQTSTRRRARSPSPSTICPSCRSRQSRDDAQGRPQGRPGQPADLRQEDDRRHLLLLAGPPDPPHGHQQLRRSPKTQTAPPAHASLSERPFDPDLSGGTVNNLAGSYSPMEIASDQERRRPGALQGRRHRAPRASWPRSRESGAAPTRRSPRRPTPRERGTEELEHPSCPGLEPGGYRGRRSGVRPGPHLRPRQDLPGRPLQRRPALRRRDSPGGCRPLRPGHDRRPGPPPSSTPKRRNCTDQDRPPASDLQGRPGQGQGHQGPSQPQPLHPQPDQLRTLCPDGHDVLAPKANEDRRQPLPGSRLRLTGLQAKARHPALRRHPPEAPIRNSRPSTRRDREMPTSPRQSSPCLIRSSSTRAHISTVCTRVQFAAATACPAASIYGHAEAKTPLLEETLSGPVYLRSSDHKLPDLVADLHGIVDVEVVGRIDSIKGGIRANFESIPDVPVESFTISMQGGKKGLLVNSRNICAHTYRINAEFSAQNGKEATLRPRSCRPAVKAGARQSGVEALRRRSLPSRRSVAPRLLPQAAARSWSKKADRPGRLQRHTHPQRACPDTATAPIEVRSAATSPRPRPKAPHRS